MITRKPTVAAPNSVAVQLGPRSVAMLAMEEHEAQCDPSRVLHDLAEELGRMAARAMLRALDHPKTGEMVLGLVMLLISIIVIAGGHGSTPASAN